MAFFVKAFQKGSWLSKSNSMLSDKHKVMALLAQLTLYFRKGGLDKVRNDLRLLAAYIGDIMHGRYKDYNRMSLTLALAAIIYVVSPLDIVPDVLPLGFVDDISIVTWAISRLTAELEKYASWRKLQPRRPEIELNDDEPLILE